MSPHNPTSSDAMPEDFAAWVHDALAHLYDSAHLKDHPVAAVLLSAAELDAFNPTQKLRRALLDGIESLRPAAGMPAGSPDWNAYHILELRYIEGLNPAEVMNQLSVSRSKFFQDQARALDMLTAVLWSSHRGRADAQGDAGASEARRDLIQSESQRLKSLAGDEPLDVGSVLEDLHSVVGPLAAAHGSTVIFEATTGGGLVAANRVMLRQALLNLLAYAVKAAAGGQVTVRSFNRDGEMGLSVLIAGSVGHGEPPESDPQGGGLAVCAELTAAMGGSLSILQPTTDGALGWQAILALPTIPSRTVLLIDDNEGLIELFKRYLAGQGRQVVGVHDGRRALELAQELHPTVIVLDVMMPDEDGWEVLLALKSRPETRDIPVLICSVVNEPDLARSLGAAGSISKPVTQETLLSALGPWY
jgi:CheY-like chemotaxis protein